MKSVALVGDNAFGSDELHGATGSVVVRPTQSGVEPPRPGRPSTFLVPRQSGKSSQLKNLELSDLLVRSTIGPLHFGHLWVRADSEVGMVSLLDLFGWTTERDGGGVAVCKFAACGGCLSK